MLDTTKIGDSIYAHRKRAGLTQRKLGELAMIGRSNISSYENGKIPCLYNAIAIADALRVSLDDLIGRVVMDCPTLTPPNEPLPVLINDEPDREYIDYICPRCKDTISQRRRGQRMETVYQCKYHDNCGQRVDWENPQPYRRPPEGEEGDADRG